MDDRSDYKGLVYRVWSQRETHKYLYQRNDSAHIVAEDFVFNLTNYEMIGNPKAFLRVKAGQDNIIIFKKTAVDAKIDFKYGDFGLFYKLNDAESIAIAKTRTYY